MIFGADMKFENLKLKEIDFVVKYTSSLNFWNAKNRKNHIIGIALTGDELHNFGDRQFSITGGSVFFLNQSEDYSVKVIEKCLSYSIHFTTYEPIDLKSFCIKINSLDELEKLFDKILKYYKGANNSDLLMSCCFYQICAEFYSILQRKYYPADKRILTAHDYAAEHFTEPECLNYIYKSASVSRRQFDSLFKKVYGVTPNRYINNLKVSYAKKMLESSNLSVAEIADICGFCDVYYFSNYFKKETGCSPTQFRIRQ